MITPWRYLILVLVTVVRLIVSQVSPNVLTLLKLGLHFILTVSHEAYGNATSISRFISKNKDPQESHNVIPDQYHWPDEPPFVLERRANATIVMLARNGDINGVAKSIKQMEDRFNKRFRYPYVLLNEEEFSDQFRECVIYPAPVAGLTLLTTITIRPQESDWTDRCNRRVWTYSSGPLASAWLDRRGEGVRGARDDGEEPSDLWRYVLSLLSSFLY
jgi:hypothetical protein